MNAPDLDHLTRGELLELARHFLPQIDAPVLLRARVTAAAAAHKQLIGIVTMERLARHHVRRACEENPRSRAHRMAYEDAHMDVLRAELHASEAWRHYRDLERELKELERKAA